MKRFTCILLCMLMLCGCARNTSGENDPETTQETTMETTVQPTTVPVTEPEETDPVIPNDGRLNIYYDDRPTAMELLGVTPQSVQILTEEVTSMQLGSTQPDTAVLRYDSENGQFFAVGVGLATVIADGTEYKVRVSTAPIDLVLIIGHSLGAGQTGVPAQSVKCIPGQAYSTTLRDNVSFPSPQTGLGADAAERPNGIDAMTTGGGVQGEAGGLAWSWNQLTGEKIWVLNGAVGGSCLNEWVGGTAYMQNAMTLFTTAQFVLQNEVAARHYRLKDVAVIYHSAANFGYKGVTYDDHMAEACYSSMISTLNTAMLDVDGDGNMQKLDAIGLVPCWTNGSTEKHEYDKPANYYMGASKAYPQVFVASMATRDWCSIQGIRDHFPQFDYVTHSQPVTMPSLLDDIFSDGVHLTQVAYNAVGMDIARNLYQRLRAHVPCSSVTVLTEYFMDTGDSVKLRKGIPTKLILLPEPFQVCDLTVAVSEGLELTYPFVLRAQQEGSYTVTVSQGQTILKTITVTVE